jgi:hypothetical protein
MCFEWGTRDVYKILMGKLCGKQPLGRMIRKWRNNVTCIIFDGNYL